AGMSNMRFSIFLLLTILGTLIWNVLLISVGVVLGANWENILGFMDIYSNIVYVFLLISVFIVIYLYIRMRKKRKKE
ncbi:hypothetical protein JYK21_02220, partial [Ralstonia pickettii]|nr:hypothetical protein [Ralstonia pickettii]